MPKAEYNRWVDTIPGAKVSAAAAIPAGDDKQRRDPTRPRPPGDLDLPEKPPGVDLVWAEKVDLAGAEGGKAVTLTFWFQNRGLQPIGSGVGQGRLIVASPEGKILADRLTDPKNEALEPSQKSRTSATVKLPAGVYNVNLALLVNQRAVDTTFGVLEVELNDHNSVLSFSPGAVAPSSQPLPNPPTEPPAPRPPGATVTTEQRQEAEAWNRAHIPNVVKFDRATGGRFAKRNGELDADGVARWQAEQGLTVNGTADDKTVDAAARLKGSGPQQLPPGPSRPKPQPVPSPGQEPSEPAPSGSDLKEVDPATLKFMLSQAKEVIYASRSKLARSYEEALSAAKEIAKDKTDEEQEQILMELKANYYEKLAPITKLTEWAEKLARQVAENEKKEDAEALRKLADETEELRRSVGKIQSAFN